MISCTVQRKKKERKRIIMDLIANQILMRILGLRNEEIERIDGIAEDKTVKITVTLAKREKECCPVCGSIGISSNGFYTKRIILSDENFRDTKVFLRVRRYLCRDCKSGFSDGRNLSPTNSSVSYAVIMKLMDLLKDPHLTFKSAAALCGISETFGSDIAFAVRGMAKDFPASSFQPRVSCTSSSVPFSMASM